LTCKRDLVVRDRDETETFGFSVRDETETRPSLDFFETETRPRHLKIGLETVSRPRRRDRDYIPDV